MLCAAGACGISVPRALRGHAEIIEGSRTVSEQLLLTDPGEYKSELSLIHMQGIVTVGDYDGVVAQVHIPSGHLLADVDEYMGRRYAVLLPLPPCKFSCSLASMGCHVAKPGPRLIRSAAAYHCCMGKAACS